MFGKVNVLFNKQNRFSQIVDIVKNYMEVYFKMPNSTKWNSYFDAKDFYFCAENKTRLNLMPCVLKLKLLGCIIMILTLWKNIDQLWNH